jgi:hypothetical protein
MFDSRKPRSPPLLAGQARARRLLFPVGPNVDLVASAAALGADNTGAKPRNLGILRITRQSTRAVCRQASFRHEAINRATPSSRMLPSVIGGP